MSHKIGSKEINNTDFDKLVSNILDVYEIAVDMGLDAACKHWYETAYNDCKLLAQDYNRTIDVVIGVVAALSPQCPWIWNVSNAGRLFRGEKTTCYMSNVQKGWRIDKGERPIDVLGGRKTSSFYKNITSQGFDDNVVTIDTWAVRVAVGRMGPVSGLTPKAYDTLERAYQTAAMSIDGINAVQLQAITWECYRQLNGYADADWKVID